MIGTIVCAEDDPRPAWTKEDDVSDQPTESEQPKPKTKEPARVHEVKFVTYPKLLFIWPLILAGFVLYPFGKSDAPARAGNSSGRTGRGVASQ